MDFRLTLYVVTEIGVALKITYDGQSVSNGWQVAILALMLVILGALPLGLAAILLLIT